MKPIISILILGLLLAVVVVLIIVNQFYPLRQSFSDSGALIQLASSSPAYFPVLVDTDKNGNYIYPQGYPWLTNISTRDPLYRTPYLAGIYGDWQYYNYPGLYPYYPFVYRQVVDMDKVKASDAKDLK
jgi:hypothetical protein